MKKARKRNHVEVIGLLVACVVVLAMIGMVLLNRDRVVIGDIDITADGEIVCLPHKGGPTETQECAFGLKAGGEYYALKTTPSYWRGLDRGSEVKVDGTLKAVDKKTVYDVSGVIDVRSIKKR